MMHNNWLQYLGIKVNIMYFPPEFLYSFMKGKFMNDNPYESEYAYKHWVENIKDETDTLVKDPCNILTLWLFSGLSGNHNFSHVQLSCQVHWLHKKHTPREMQNVHVCAQVACLRPNFITNSSCLH